MANDGTLNQRESGVGIFDQLTFQNDTPIGGGGGAEKEEESRQAHEAAYGDNNNQAASEEESGMMSNQTEPQDTLGHSPEFGYDQPAIEEQPQNILEAEYEEEQTPEPEYQGVFGYGSEERLEGMREAAEQEQEIEPEPTADLEQELEAE